MNDQIIIIIICNTNNNDNNTYSFVYSARKKVPQRRFTKVTVNCVRRIAQKIVKLILEALLMTEGLDAGGTTADRIMKSVV